MIVLHGARPAGRQSQNSFAEGTQGKFQPSFLSSSVVGSVNRGLVIQALFDLGPTSRAELARLAGVNRTTISGIVQSLIDDQVLVETEPGQAKRSGGKPARPLWFSPSARPICGVLLMPDAVRACLTTLDGAIIGENRISLPAGDGPVSPIIEAVKRSMRLALADAVQTPLGVGVAVGGMVDTNQGSIVAMNSRPRARRLSACRRARARIRPASTPRPSPPRAASRRPMVRQGPRSAAIRGDLYGGGAGRRILFRWPSLSRCRRGGWRIGAHLRSGRRRALPVRPPGLLGHDRYTELASPPGRGRRVAQSRRDELRRADATGRRRRLRARRN